MPDEAEYQPQNSIFQTMLLPDATSSVNISGGRIIPHTFYLGPNNTVPFVRLENPAASKEISWGELIIVQPGQQVAIRNTSCMPGDLQIQSGSVPAPPPPRVTITVRCTITPTTPADLPYTEWESGYTHKITPEFPCETRAVRRAWLVLRPALAVYVEPTPEEPYSGMALNDANTVSYARVRNYYHMHSRIMQNQPTEWSFEHVHRGTDIEAFMMIPLGLNVDGNAMRLADYAKADVFIGAVGGAFGEDLVSETAAYLLEY